MPPLRRLLPPLFVTGTALPLPACLVNTDLYNQRRAELLAELAEGAGDTAAPDHDTGGDDSGPTDDLDGDGYPTDEDCDDTDPSVHPDAPETWLDDGVDNDCDGQAWEAVVWSATEATTRLDGVEPGGEFGRRMGFWEAGDCLLVAAPYVGESEGRVYAFEGGTAGVRRAEGRGTIDGSGAYRALANVISARGDGRLLLTEPSMTDGAGVAWLVDASVPCGGGQVALDSGAAGRIDHGEVGAYLGTSGRWVPDLDGDGVDDLVIGASMASGGGGERGAVFVFLDPPTDGEVAATDDADHQIVGSHDGARLSIVEPAEVRDGDGLPVLLFAQAGAVDGAGAVVRVDASALGSGPVDGLGTGSLRSYATDMPSQLTVVGDTDHDGEDNLIAGVWTWGLWNVSDLDGTVVDSDATTTFDFAGDDDWLTGFDGVGDIDGDGLGDFLVFAEDWPASTEQGAAALMSGGDITPDAPHDFLSARLRAEGAEVGDSLGYRALPVGDFDGDGRLDMAVAAYGTDFEGASSGSVFLLPSPF